MAAPSFPYICVPVKEDSGLPVQLELILDAIVIQLALVADTPVIAFLPDLDLICRSAVHFPGHGSSGAILIHRGAAQEIQPFLIDLVIGSDDSATVHSYLKIVIAVIRLELYLPDGNIIFPVRLHLYIVSVSLRDARVLQRDGERSLASDFTGRRCSCFRFRLCARSRRLRRRPRLLL